MLFLNACPQLVDGRFLLFFLLLRRLPFSTFSLRSGHQTHEAKGAVMEKNIFSDKCGLGLQKTPFSEQVIGEREQKDLPPGMKGGEELRHGRHYEHKQHTFDSYCKKVLKCEAYNGYREISRRQKELVDGLRSMLGLAAKVTLVAPKSIVRSEGKAVRIIDKRKLY